MKRAYLATSYSYKTKMFGYATSPRGPWWLRPICKIVQYIRYRRVSKATAKLMEKTGWNIFSPITHSHIIPKWIPTRLDTHTFWLGLDFDWIETCDELWVFMQPGWDQSYGVEKEMILAKGLGMKVRYVNMWYDFIGDDPEFYPLPKD